MENELAGRTEDSSWLDGLVPSRRAVRLRVSDREATAFGTVETAGCQGNLGPEQVLQHHPLGGTDAPILLGNFGIRTDI